MPVVLSRKDGSTRQRHEQLAVGIDTAYREGNLHLSLHLFNTADQADEALRVLNAPTDQSRRCVPWTSGST